MTDLIYRAYPDLAEGEMARLRSSVVNTDSLAEVATEIGLGDEVRLGKGEEASGGRTKASILANTFEAVVGAIYLDRGLSAVMDALGPMFTDRLEVSQGSGHRYDAKTALQEVAVRLTGTPPTYRVSSSGPDHDKRFSAQVVVADEVCGSGSGRSKKQAEYLAAREALEHLDAGSDLPRETAPAAADERRPDARAS